MGISYQARSFNLGVAGFAGAATAFAAFAMPEILLKRLVANGALSPLVELAGSARIAAVAALGFAAFLVVWMLLQLIDRLEARSVPDAEEELDWPAPRLRRADSHPDAPATRPILAKIHFGEPVWTDPDAPADSEQEPLDLDGYQTAPGAWERRLVAIDLEQDDPAADEDEDLQDQSATGGLPNSLLARLSLPQERRRNVSTLIERLDTRLAACEWPLPSQPQPQPQAPDYDVDDRLRSALDELQKMAARSR